MALAAPHDDAAKKLIQKAMYEDYVGTNFAEAGKELEQALALCQAATDCAPTGTPQPPGGGGGGGGGGHGGGG